MFEDVEDHLALAEPVQHHRDRAELEAGRRQPHEVRRDPVQLAQHHADDLGAFRHLDPEQAFRGGAVRELVEEVREVIHASHERDALLPRSVLGVLLDPGVQVADHRPARHDGLAVELQHQPKHAVRRGVLRPHVDDEGLLAEPLVVLPRHGVRGFDGEGMPLAHGDRSSTGGMNAPPLYMVSTPPSE